MPLLTVGATTYGEYEKLLKREFEEDEKFEYDWSFKEEIRFLRFAQYKRYQRRRW